MSPPPLPPLSAVATVAAMRDKIQIALGELAKAARMKNLATVDRESIETPLYAAIAFADSIDRRMREARRTACEVTIEAPHDPHLGGSCTTNPNEE